MSFAYMAVPRDARLDGRIDCEIVGRLVELAMEEETLHEVYGDLAALIYTDREAFERAAIEHAERIVRWMEQKLDDAKIGGLAPPDWPRWQRESQELRRLRAERTVQ